MRIIVAPDYESLSLAAAEVFAAALRHYASPVVVCATGNSPVGTYHALARRHAAVVRSARIVTLDEYAGIGADDDRILYNWLERDFLSLLEARPPSPIRFQAWAPDAEVEARRVEQLVRQTGGLDCQILGLGRNGHIGFNEPGSAFDSATRVVDLTPESIASNAAYWGGADRVPRRAFTLGLGLIRSAAWTLMVVNGSHKADILHALVCGPVGSAVPATVLRTMSNVVIVTDREAAARLPAELTEEPQDRMRA